MDSNDKKGNDAVFRCPCCGLDVTTEVEQWLKRRENSDARRQGAESLLKLITKMHQSVMAQIDNDSVSEEEFKEQLLREEKIIEKIKAERDELVTRKRVSLEMRDQRLLAAQSRQRQTVRRITELQRQQAKKNMGKAWQTHRANQLELLSDIHKHREYVEMEYKHAEGLRQRNARNAFLELSLERNLRHVNMILLHKSRGKKFIRTFHDEESFKDCLAEFPVLGNRQLYVRKYQIDEKNYVCGLYQMIGSKSMSAMVWVLGLDISHLYPGTDTKYEEMMQTSMARAKKKAEDMGLLKNGGEDK